jgi:AcrR family transcriptional regulator
MASTRQGLLAAGRKLFSDKGLYESRVEEITETADVGKGTLYRYFRNKEELIRAVVEAGFDDLRRRIEDRVSQARGVDESIRFIAEVHVSFFADNPDLMRIFHQVRGMLKFDRPEWRPLVDSLDHHLAFLASELRRHPDGPRASRARSLAALLFGSISGTLSVQVAIHPHLNISSLTPLIVAGARGLMGPFLSRGEP